MPEERDGEVDVEALFDEISDEAKAADAKLQAAITIRPLGMKPDGGTGAAARFKAAHRSELLKAGQPAQRPPQMSEAELKMTAVGGDAVVLGVASRTAKGVVSTAGAVDGRFEERAAYLARLAAMVGEELGLETLRELHAVGGDKRLAWVGHRDGSSSTIVADADTDMSAVVKKLLRKPEPT